MVDADPPARPTRAAEARSAKPWGSISDARVNGVQGHFSEKVGYFEGTATVRPAIAQWCFPLRRQQAGNEASSGPEASSGAISGRLKTATSSMTNARRMNQ